MTLEILAIAFIFMMPVVLSVIALTGERSPWGLLRAVLRTSETEYAADMDNIPASH